MNPTTSSPSTAVHFTASPHPTHQPLPHQQHFFTQSNHGAQFTSSEEDPDDDDEEGEEGSGTKHSSNSKLFSPHSSHSISSLGAGTTKPVPFPERLLNLSASGAGGLSNSLPLGAAGGFLAGRSKTNENTLGEGTFGRGVGGGGVAMSGRKRASTLMLPGTFLHPSAAPRHPSSSANLLNPGGLGSLHSNTRRASSSHVNPSSSQRKFSLSSSPLSPTHPSFTREHPSFTRESKSRSISISSNLPPIIASSIPLSGGVDRKKDKEREREQRHRERVREREREKERVRAVKEKGRESESELGGSTRGASESEGQSSFSSSPLFTFVGLLNCALSFLQIGFRC